ncbi:MAG: sugar phosphate nucleotidyltransferase [Candidatus Woesearchaeota archaeon]
MRKSKIAISLDKPLLDIIDSKVDGSIIRSRSQAIEYYLKKGLGNDFIDIGIIFLKGEHQKYSLMNLQGKPLIFHQIYLLETVGINFIYLLTQNSIYTNQLEKLLAKTNVKIVFTKAKGTAEALNSIRNILHNREFIAMSGDIYNMFDIKKMVLKHKSYGKIVTMGLISKSEMSKSGAVILDGDIIIDFEEKPKTPKSNIANAGIYIMSSRIFEYLNRETISLERDVFPKLAKKEELVGFFTHGEYKHMEQ